MAIIKVHEKKVLNWRRQRVGCKRSSPNQTNAPPVKKKTKTNHGSWSYQKKQDEMIPDWEEPKEEATADNTLSVSAEENWTKDAQHDTSEIHLAEGGDSYLAYSHSQYETNETHFSVGGDSDVLHSYHQYKTVEGSTKNEEPSNAESLVDKWACRVCKAAAVSIATFPCCHLCPCWNCEFEIDNCPICGMTRSDGGKSSAKDGNSYVPNSRSHDNTIKTHFSVEDGNSYIRKLASKCNTIGAHISAKGIDAHFPDSRSLYDTDGSHFLAEGGDSNLPDLLPQNNTAEESTKNEEASEAESQVDKWACHVCKAATVSIVVLPCSHLCLCWNCELETASCPICGEPKTNVFYIRN